MASSYTAQKDPLLGSDPIIGVPARQVVLLTPDDVNDLAQYSRALRVYVASGPATVVVIPTLAADDSNTVTLTFPTGLWLEPISVRRVKSSGLSGSPIIHALL